MARFDDFGGREAEPAQNVELYEVIGLLRRVSVVLDRLWNYDLMEAKGREAMRLGEASYNVHRALIALSEDAPKAPGSFGGRVGPVSGEHAGAPT